MKPFTLGGARRPQATPAAFLEDDSDDDDAVALAAGDAGAAHAAHRQGAAATQAARLLSEGTDAAEAGDLEAALSIWERACALDAGNAVLHEQKAQVLLMRDDAWRAIQSATTATQLRPDWAPGWLTLARAQLNYGEPELAAASYERALELQPDQAEARTEAAEAGHLVAQRQRRGETGRMHVVPCSGV